MANKSYLSTAQTFTAGSPLPFPPWVPSQGPTGNRNIIDRLVVETTYSWTVATAVIQGENVPSIFSNIQVSDSGGLRRNFSGAGCRLATIAMNGAKSHQEEADIAVGAPTTGVARLEIPFRIKRARDGNEYTIPAELMREITLQCAAAGALDLGSSAVTFGATSVAIRAYCHEEVKATLKVRDLVDSNTMKTTTEHTVVCGGLLDFMQGFAEGDSLLSMAGWASHLLSPIQEQVELRAQKVFEYAGDNDIAANGATPGGLLYNDPVMLATPKAVNIYQTPGAKPKVRDHHFVNAVDIKATNSVASVQILKRVIKPAHVATDNRVAAANGKRIGPAKRGPGGARTAQFLERKLVS